MDGSQNPCDKTLEEVYGLSILSENYSGLVSDSEVLVTANGGECNGCTKAKGVDNVEVAVEGRKGMEGGCAESWSKEDCLEAGFEEKSVVAPHSTGMGNEGVSVPEGGLEVNEIGIENVLMEEGRKEGNASQLDGVESARKVEISGNISLFVEVFCPLKGIMQTGETKLEDEVRGGASGRENSCKGNKELCDDGENGENQSANLSDIHVVGNFSMNGEAEGGNEVEEEIIANQECKFEMGDIVWVRTKPQIWWPGVICDSSDAAKSGQKGCLPVRCFGYGGSLWCSPSQLKPFIENFERLSRQSDSKSFLDAVEKAVDEIGQLVKSEMTCSCMLKNSQTTLALQIPGNSGIEERNLIKDCQTGVLRRSMVTQFEPLNFLKFLKSLAQDISMPGTLEFTVIQNRLLAFHHAVGHCQLPMHQLCRSTNGEDSYEDGVGRSSQSASGKQLEISADTVLEKKQDLTQRSGEERDVVLQKCESHVTEEGTNTSKPLLKSRNKDAESSRGSGEDVDLNVHKLASPSAKEMTCLSVSPIKTESEFFVENCDGGIEGKSGKGFVSRERKKSKYLSPPYINLKLGRKGSPVLGEDETEDCKEVSHSTLALDDTAGQCMGDPRIVKCSGKKLQKKGSRKAVSRRKKSERIKEINASPGELLSGLRFAALDCLYPNKNRAFNSVEIFFDGFRRSSFHTDPHYETPKHNGQDFNCEIHTRQTSSGDEVQEERKKEMEGAPVEHCGPKLSTGTLDTNKNAKDPGSVGKDTQEITKPKRREKRKKGEATMGLQTNTTAISDVNNNISSSGSVIIDFQATNGLAPPGIPTPKRRKKKAKVIPDLLQDNEMASRVDLNGNCPIPSSLVEGPQVMGPSASQDILEPKKKKRKDGTASVRSRTKSFLLLSDIRNQTRLDLLKDVPVTGSYSLHGVPDLINKEGMEEAASLHLNVDIIASQPDVNVNNAEISSLVNDGQQIGLLSPNVKPEPKKRKRKEKTSVDSLKTKFSAAIPDLNGNVTDPNLLGNDLPELNVVTANGKPQRKKRISKSSSGVPHIGVNHDNLPAIGEPFGNILVLKFAPGSPMPTKAALLATFGVYGLLKESETQVLNDSVSARVVFIKSADARDAFQGLQKSIPFGPALVNYRLQTAATKDLESNTNSPLPFQTMEGLKPRQGDTPDLALIKQNLQMMTSMMEKAGDNLSPEMRANLESQIKGLLNKVSTMVGPSSSS